MIDIQPLCVARTFSFLNDWILSGVNELQKMLLKTDSREI